MQMVVQRVQKAVEISGGLLLAPAQIRVHVRLDGASADLLAHGVAHLTFIQLFVLMNQMVQVAHLVIQPGWRKGRCLVADHHSAAPALGLNGFADVVLNVGVDDWQIACRQPGIVVGGQAAILARQPLLGAVGAQMDQRIRAGAGLQVAVGGQIAVIGRAVTAVIVAGFAAARHLRHQQQVTELPGRQDKRGFAVDLAHRRVLLGRALCGQRALPFCWQAVQPLLILGDRIADGQPLGQQLLGRDVAVQGAQQALGVINNLLLADRLTHLIPLGQQCLLD